MIQTWIKSMVIRQYSMIQAWTRSMWGEIKDLRASMEEIGAVIN